MYFWCSQSGLTSLQMSWNVGDLLLCCPPQVFSPLPPLTWRALKPAAGTHVFGCDIPCLLSSHFDQGFFFSFFLLIGMHHSRHTVNCVYIPHIDVTISWPQRPHLWPCLRCRSTEQKPLLTRQWSGTDCCCSDCKNSTLLLVGVFHSLWPTLFHKWI